MTPKPNLKTGKAGKCLKKERKALGKRGAEVPNSVFNHWRAEQKHRKRRETGDEAAMAAGGGGGRRAQSLVASRAQTVGQKDCGARKVLRGSNSQLLASPGILIPRELSVELSAGETHAPLGVHS